MKSIARNHLLAVSLLLISSLAACQLPANDHASLTIFAASSLNDAMDALVEGFQRQHPEVTFRLNYASSAQLAIQLDQGADADLFASADQAQMAFAIERGRITGTPVNFATNSIVLLAPAGNPGSVSDVRDLAQQDLRVLLTVPGTPLRGYSDQVLNRLSDEYPNGADLREQIYANVVSEEENARQVVAKIALGEADAAFAYRSDAESELAENSSTIDIDPSLQVAATYPLAVVAGTDQAGLSEQFIEYVLSPEGQGVLAHWGFGPRTQP